MSTINIERCIRQYHSHTRTFRTGMKAIGLPGNVWDLFTGNGWKERIRFRLIKRNVLGGTTTELEQLSGPQLTPTMRALILKELA